MLMSDWKNKYLVFGWMVMLYACTAGGSHAPEKVEADEAEPIYMAYSEAENTYEGFHSPNAINRAADIENEYFRAYENGTSHFYGTRWVEASQHVSTSEDSLSWYKAYTGTLGVKPDSMHCTLYAVEALKAGMGDQFPLLEAAHKEIWGNREYAGWSIGYLLVEKFGWEAVLIIDSHSPEFRQCEKAFRNRKVYPVWRQPDIPLTDRWIIGESDSLIQDQLAQHEFGWGFSRQGYHTWFTRFEELKECNWWGAPGRKWEVYAGNKPLFLTTPFSVYQDYLSHVIVFPPKAAR